VFVILVSGTMVVGAGVAETAFQGRLRGVGDPASCVSQQVNKHNTTKHGHDNRMGMCQANCCLRRDAVHCCGKSHTH